MKTKALTIKTLLKHNPCSNGADFLKGSHSLQRAWETCKRADWMIWALARLGMLNDDDDIARGFACDCAEHTLHFFEDKYPDDKRPRLAIEASRRTITDKSPEAIAARAAAGDAAWAAAWAAARVAAWGAAGAVARAAAGAAAWAAAWDAAGDAAWDAAWDAARAAAGDASWAAAWDAAGDAAWDAAWDAENEWQANRLRAIYNPFKP